MIATVGTSATAHDHDGDVYTYCTYYNIDYRGYTT